VVQPIFDMASGAIVGHEALARFAHDTDVGAVFHRAHADGVGDLLEAATVRAALALPDPPVGQMLFVNVSAAALASARFRASLPARLDDVIVELVEDTAITDWGSLNGVLTRLVERGAQLAVDDLGAGAGDISRLLVVRPGIVKLDRGPVHGCSRDTNRAQLIQAVLQLARAGGAQVCAEGVEDDTDLTLLREMGIELVQGYLTGRPSPNWAAPPQPTAHTSAWPALANSRTE
jgi:EAL domain-containing protein (putative c-di-GMP-specific phosphodiesterase class I)